MPQPCSAPHNPDTFAVRTWAEVKKAGRKARPTLADAAIEPQYCGSGDRAMLDVRFAGFSAGFGNLTLGQFRRSSLAKRLIQKIPRNGRTIAFQRARQPEAALGSADEDTDRRIRGAILAYLLAHPAAGDTIEGIRLWWLRDAGDLSFQAVKEALEALVERGWLMARGTKDEDRIYGLNGDQKEVIEQSMAGESIG